MSQDEINDVADVWMEDYEALYPYLDYRIEDGSGTVLGRSTANTGNGLTDDSFKEYAFGMVLTYDEHGNPDVKVVKSGEKTAQSIVLRKIIDNWSETVEDATHGELKTPKNRTYIYGMKKSSIEQYLNQWYWFGDEAPNDVYDACLHGSSMRGGMDFCTERDTENWWRKDLPAAIRGCFCCCVNYSWDSG